MDGGQQWVAFLRGVNVGGHHKVPMGALRACLEALGLGEVRTLIQSGNLVFRSSLSGEELVEGLGRAIQARFGFAVPVVVRSATQLRSVMAGNPFPTDGVDPRFLHVGFLSAWPAPEVVASLDGERFAPDSFQVIGQEVYISYPKGAARSKLTAAWFDRTLGCVITARNWRTLGRVVSMLEAP